MTRADARFDGGGWHYGVRFNDGSVRAPWNGSTQRGRALTLLAYLRSEYAGDSYALVRRRLGGEWELAGE